jgi:hypothetical protein
MLKSRWLLERPHAVDDTLSHIKNGHTLADAIVDTVREAFLNARFLHTNGSFKSTASAMPRHGQRHCRSGDDLSGGASGSSTRRAASRSCAARRSIGSMVTISIVEGC